MLEGKKVNLYFRNSAGEEEIVDVGLVGMDAVKSAIETDVKARNPNFKIYYHRVWESLDNRIWFDVGSHTEFYVGDIVPEKDFECEECKI